jgi:predicted O-linked N-acetylglucosamine transferase (SPINDLY family)
MAAEVEDRLRRIFEQAIACHRTGRLADAERLYREILAVQPGQLAALNMLGAAHAQQGRHREALECYEAALKVQPASPATLLSAGISLHHEGRPQEALARFDQALALSPSVEAHDCRGNVLYALGRHGDALQAYDRALAIDSRNPGSHYNRANALRALDRFDEAIAGYRKALALRPGDVEVLNNLGDVLLRLGRCGEAMEAFDAALAIAPDHAAALNNQGSAWQARGRHEDALRSFERALKLVPDFAEALNNRGISLDALGRCDDAIASYDGALAVRPGFAEAHLNRGNCLQEMNRQADAIASYRRALAAKPTLAKARLGLCMAQLRILYDSEAEIAERREAYRRELTGLIDEVGRTGDYAELAPGVGGNQPFLLAYQGQSDRDLQGLYGSFVCRVMAARYPAAALPLPPVAGEPVRVGIVSGFFREHSNWKIPIKGWLGQLDRGRFRLFGYHTGARRDAETEAAAGLCHRFVEGPRTVDGWREAILADAPHVLIYPEIGMDPVAVQLAAQRLAPSQCNSWGHPDTSGFPTLDYYLSGDLMEPRDGEQHYSERLVRLPNLSIYYEPVEAPPALDRALLGLRAGATVFWCGQSLFKYLPQYDQVFARIARGAGDCQFAFIGYAKGNDVTAQFRRRLERAFAAAGLRADDHCIFLGRLDQRRFAAAIGACDIVLDSIGWSGCNSTLEGLPYGLPVVTLRGALMRGRHSTAILDMMGVGETVAATVVDYVSIAVRLAGDLGWRRAISERMAASAVRVYRDRACIAALETFLDRVARTGGPT